MYRNRAGDRPTELYFNYRTKQNLVWDNAELQEDWNYQVNYPPMGSLVDL